MKKHLFSSQHVLHLGLILTLLAGMAGTVTRVRSEPLGTTLVDTTTGTATNDGTVNAGEYVASTLGINAGFGDVIGMTSRLYIDSSDSGGLNFGLVKGPSAFQNWHAMVIYIDTDKGGAGFNTTSGFTDTGDPCRRAISGYDGTNRSILNFASGSPGFRADYAVCLESGFAGVWKLVNGGSHIFVTSANRQSSTAGHYEMNLTLADLGLGPGSHFDYMATYLDQTSAYRSDEFQGVDSYTGPYPGPNPGYSTVNLGSNDFHTFVSVPGVVIPSIVLGGDGPGGVGVTDGSSPLEVWLRGDRDVYTDTGCTSASPNGNIVSCWKDQSGNAVNVTQASVGRVPNYATGAQNGQAALIYTGGVDADVLTANLAAYSGDPAYSIFFAFNPSNNSGENLFAVGSPANLQNVAYQPVFSGSRNLYHWGDDLAVVGSASGWQIAAFLYSKQNPGTTDRFYYANGSLAGSNEAGALNLPSPPLLSIGGYSNRTDPPNGNELTGSIGEAIFYSTALADVDRILVNNFLSSKYNLALGANDVYDGDTSGNGEFDLDVAGIGWSGSDRHVQSHSAGMIVRNATFLQAAGDWLLFGHKSITNSNVFTDLPTTGDWATAPFPARWARHWYIDVTDEATVTGGKVDIIFDFSEAKVTGGITPDAPASNYRLLKRSGATGQFSDITAASGATVAIAGDQVQFLNVDVNQLGSNFTLGTLDTGDSPTAVLVQSFYGEPFAGLSYIHWQTQLEYAFLGFNLYRRKTLEGTQTKLNSTMIPPQGLGQPNGASYTFVDSGLTPGQEYYYWLEVVYAEETRFIGYTQVTGEFGFFLPLLIR